MDYLCESRIDLRGPIPESLWVWGLRFRFGVSDFGFRVWGLELRVSGFGFRVESSSFRV